jgi:hypothetical protein
MRASIQATTDNSRTQWRRHDPPCTTVTVTFEPIMPKCEESRFETKRDFLVLATRQAAGLFFRRNLDIYGRFHVAEQVNGHLMLADLPERLCELELAAVELQAQFLA